MHTFTAPDTTSTQEISRSTLAASLSELDAILHVLWAHEPELRFGERHHCLNMLRQLMIDVERLLVRALFHRDEPIDAAAVADCTTRTAHLAGNWSSELWITTPWPADVLGDRTAPTRSAA